MINDQQPEWKTPELVVLVRSRPEEAVLATCKHSGVTTPATGSASNRTGCKLHITGNTCLGTDCADPKSS